MTATPLTSASADHYQTVYRSAWDRLLRASDILLISPRMPDGDSLGSICGLRLALLEVGKHSTLFCVDPAPSTYDLLPGIHELVVGFDALHGKTFDMVVIVDAGDLQFAGVDDILPRLRRPGGIVLSIDHHVTNTRFGDVNCVIPTASSTTQVITNLLDAAQVPLTAAVATCLFLGLAFDTDGFTNPATTAAATSTAARLTAAGARFGPILHALYRNKSIPGLRLWGRALERLHLHLPWGIAVTVLTPNDFLELPDGRDVSAGLSNFLQTILPVKAILVLKDSGTGLVRGSLRTQRDDVDLGKLAALLGGGGHQKASGFAVPGRLVERDGHWCVEDGVPAEREAKR